VREWLKALSKEDCKVIGTDILTVQYAWPVGKPLVDNLGDGIWEVRSRLDNGIARTLFAMVDQEIVLLHGFIKKQQKTPADELDRAKKRKKTISVMSKKNNRGGDFRDFLNEQGILGEVEARARAERPQTIAPAQGVEIGGVAVEQVAARRSHVGADGWRQARALRRKARRRFSLTASVGEVKALRPATPENRKSRVEARIAAGRKRPAVQFAFRPRGL